jgi:hypothetical protein
MFRSSTAPIIRSYQLYTWQLVRFIQVTWSLQRPHNLHETYQLPRIQLITPDDGRSRCPKNVELRDKINFGYLVHLVCYLYEDYHDARSLEHKVALRILSHKSLNPASYRYLQFLVVNVLLSCS